MILAVVLTCATLESRSPLCAGGVEGSPSAATWSEVDSLTKDLTALVRKPCPSVVCAYETELAFKRQGNQLSMRLAKSFMLDKTSPPETTSHILVMPGQHRFEVFRDVVDVYTASKYLTYIGAHDKATAEQIAEKLTRLNVVLTDPKP